MLEELGEKEYKVLVHSLRRGFTDGSAVKNPPAYAGDAGSILGLRRLQEQEMATRSSILA